MQSFQRLLFLGGVVVAVGCEHELGVPAPSQSGETQEQVTSMAGNESIAAASPDGDQIAFVSDRDGSSNIYLVASDGSIRPLVVSSHENKNPTWSPDGTQLAFQSVRDGHPGVWMIEVEGGDPSLMTPPGMVAFHPTWSPDGTTVAFISDAEGSYDVWSIAATGGLPTRVTDHPDHEWWPHWSPDSGRLAFYTTWGDQMTDIWTIGRDGTDLRQITTEVGEDYRPAWSPDGEWIAFISNRSGRSDVWVIPAFGGAAVQLTDDEVDRDFPSWSRDGTSLLVAYQPNPSIYAVPASGGDPQRVTRGEGSAWNPVASPTGEHVAFEARNDREENIWVTSTQGSDARVLAGINEFQAYPAWSPDGRTVAFAQGAGGDSRSAELWTASLAEGTPRRLTTLGYVSDPVWCEGRGIVFASKESEIGDSQLWRIESEEGVPVPLTQLPGHNRPTDCSQDGSMVLFTQAERGAYSGVLRGAGRLFTIPSSGGEPTPIEPGRNAEGGRWSPDGSQIAFISNDDGPPQLYVTRSSEEGSPLRLSHGEQVQSWPSWSPDGQSIYVSMTEGGQDIWRLDVEQLLNQTK